MRRVVLLVCLALAASAPAARAEPSTCGERPPPSDLPWIAAMPPSQDTAIQAFDVAVPSPDGTPLSSRVYLPDAYQAPKPTVLWISPCFYQAKKDEDNGLASIADCYISFFLTRGYAFVLADSRGTGGSGGCPDVNGGPSTRADGKALVDWIAEQNWSDGTVGVRGLSLEGQAAYSTAIAAPDALKAVIAASPTNGYDLLYYGGVPFEHRYVYPALDAQYIVRGPETICPELVTTPLSLDGTRTPYWRERDLPSLAGTIRAPVLHTHGTGGSGPTSDSTWEFPAFWAGLGRAGVPRKAFVGPWEHGWPPFDGWNYYELRWFEHWLQGNDTGMVNESPLTLIGSDGVARTPSVFPPGATTTLEIGAGRLAPSTPDGLATYTDVPGIPRALLRAADGARLLYTGDPLTEPLRISGNSTLELMASIDRTSTHFVARLYDAAPDGSATTLTFGYLDALHRVTLDEAEPVTPGAFERYAITLYAPEYVVPAGHHLELVIASSDMCGPEIFVNVTGDCRAFGVVSDPSLATVTVDEGASRVSLSTAPL